MWTIPSTTRVAFISEGLNLGGSTTFLCNIGGELIRRGASAMVINLEANNPLVGTFQKEQIPVSIVGGGKRIYEERAVECLRILREFQPTMVVGNLGSCSYEILRYAPAGVARVAIVHSDDPDVFKGLGAYRESLDAVVSVSNTILKRLQSMAPYADKRLVPIPCGVPMPPELPPDTADDGVLRILYLGRLENAQKRVRLFPQIYRSLCKSGIPFRWTLIGDGVERPYLEAEMKGGSPDQQVIFHGQVSYDEVPALLGSQDVSLLASSFEGLPLSLLETMSHGIVPVVSALESGIPEIVNPSNGILVPVDDIDGYAQALVHLHHHRAELAKKRLTARAAVYPAYSLTAMTDRWLELNTQLASAPAQWPAKPAILPLLGSEHTWTFTTFGRWARRLKHTIKG